METIKIRYRRSLKRKNFSSCTIRNYLNRIDRFLLWLPIPLHQVTRREIGSYVDHLLGKRLSPKTITCHLQTIRLFFDYLTYEEELPMENPVRKISIRLPKPLPRHLKDGEVEKLRQIPRHAHRIGAIHRLFQYHRKLIASSAGHRVGAPNPAHEKSADMLEQLVADMMPHGVVDQLEAVQID